MAQKGAYDPEDQSDRDAVDEQRVEFRARIVAQIEALERLMQASREAMERGELEPDADQLREVQRLQSIANDVFGKSAPKTERKGVMDWLRDLFGGGSDRSSPKVRAVFEARFPDVDQSALSRLIDEYIERNNEMRDSGMSREERMSDPSLDAIVDQMFALESDDKSAVPALSKSGAHGLYR